MGTEKEKAYKLLLEAATFALYCATTRIPYSEQKEAATKCIAMLTDAIALTNREDHAK